MVYCEGCGEPLSYSITNCQKCGRPTSNAPRAVAGKHLDPKRLGPNVAVSSVPSQQVAQQHLQVVKEAGSINPAIAGNYEYLKPGSVEKSKQTLALRPDGTCSYTEDGESSLDTFTSSGNGTWDTHNGVVRVVIHSLVKDTQFKSKPMVPGMKDGRTIEYNITVPITESELLNATAFGTNKWRVVQ